MFDLPRYELAAANHQTDRRLLLLLELDSQEFCFLYAPAQNPAVLLPQTQGLHLIPLALIPLPLLQRVQLPLVAKL